MGFLKSLTLSREERISQELWALANKIGEELVFSPSRGKATPSELTANAFKTAVSQIMEKYQLTADQLNDILQKGAKK